MRLHRFYINSPIKNTKFLVIDEHLIHQWRNVFRYNVGSEVILFDGTGMEYDCVIEKLGNREAGIVVVSKRKGIVPDRKIILCQSLIKKDKMEWVVEKATELGVTKIIPILAERSEKKSFNIERAKKIAIEASEQCGRADIPEIGEVVSLEEVIEVVKDSKMVILDPSGTVASSQQLVARGRNTFMSIFVGPEGGWSDKELELFKKTGKTHIISMGPLILRSETAAIFALSAFQTV